MVVADVTWVEDADDLDATWDAVEATWVEDVDVVDATWDAVEVTWVEDADDLDATKDVVDAQRPRQYLVEAAIAAVAGCDPMGRK